MKTLRRYLPHLVVFVSSMGIMIIELVADLRLRNGAGILTDNYAPVENLIAPVFLRSVD
jgi:hypothetical protein